MKNTRVVVTTFSARQWRAMVAQVGRCLCCGATTNLCADHVFPVTAGGANVWGNIQVLCRSCNAKKGTRFIDYRTRHLVQAQFDFVGGAI